MASKLYGWDMCCASREGRIHGILYKTYASVCARRAVRDIGGNKIIFCCSSSSSCCLRSVLLLSRTVLLKCTRSYVSVCTRENRILSIQFVTDKSFLATIVIMLLFSIIVVFFRYNNVVFKKINWTIYIK